MYDIGPIPGGRGPNLHEVLQSRNTLLRFVIGSGGYGRQPTEDRKKYR